MWPTAKRPLQRIPSRPALAFWAVFLLALPLLTLSACNLWDSDPMVMACERSIEQALRWPRSYDRLDSERLDDGGQSVVLIEFEAWNGLGKEVRNTARCRFQPSVRTARGAPPAVKDLVIESEIAEAPTLHIRKPYAPKQQAER